MTKMRSSTVIDQRGKLARRNRLNDEKMTEVVNYINRILKYQSHYSRQQTECQYLPSHMTLDKMYNLNVEEVEMPVTLAYYKSIFYNKFNLRRKPLQKDTCNKYDAFVVKMKCALDLEKIV